MRGRLEPVLRRIWSGHREGDLRVLERILYWFLVPFSTLYASLVWARRGAYRIGLVKSRPVGGVLVVSIGNITVGGTGKTPLAIGLARGLTEQGIPTAVISRGHGGSVRGRGPLLVSDGSGPLVGPALAGDEPVMIARAVAAPVIVSRSRILGARLARDLYGARAVILDDGFQHRALDRDADIVLLDARDPFGNRWTLPAGRLREPLSALGDADLFLFVHRGVEGVLPIPDRLRKLLEAFRPGAMILSGTLAIQSLREAAGGRPEGVGWLKGRRVVLLSGVAAPESFEREVAGLGAQVLEHHAYPDHHRYGPLDFEQLFDRAGALHAEAVVTTAKDEVKLIAAGAMPGALQVWVAQTGYDPRTIDLLVSAISGMGSEVT